MAPKARQHQTKTEQTPPLMEWREPAKKAHHEPVFFTSDQGAQAPRDPTNPQAS